MSTLQDGLDAAAGAPPWMAEAAFWLALATFLAAVAGAVGVWALVSRLRELRAEGSRLEVLEAIDHKLGRLAAEREDLDLRRLEHVLVDLREGQRRVEDALLRTLEGGPAAGERSAALALPAAPETIAERVTNRLHALGYERIQLVTRTEELAELASTGGDVRVEARREGVQHKGRVVLRGGRLMEVDLQPAYSIFP